MYSQPFVTALNAIYFGFMGLVILAGSAVLYQLVASLRNRLPKHPISASFTKENA